MQRIDHERSQALAQQMYVDPGDEDFGQCCFNARRTLFRLHRLGQGLPVYYTEGYAVYLNYDAPQPYSRVTAHAWVTSKQQVIDVDYADCGRFDAAYFPGRHWTVGQVYQRLGAGHPRSAFEFLPTSIEMTRAYVKACDYLVNTWPEQVTPYDLEHLQTWQRQLAQFGQQ